MNGISRRDGVPSAAQAATWLRENRWQPFLGPGTRRWRPPGGGRIIYLPRDDAGRAALDAALTAIAAHTRFTPEQLAAEMLKAGPAEEPACDDGGLRRPDPGAR